MCLGRYHKRVQLRCCQALRQTRKILSMDDHFVDEVKRTISACKVFVWYPIYWVQYNGMMNMFVSSAAGMSRDIPNDFLTVFDSVAIIVFIPIFERFYILLLDILLHSNQSQRFSGGSCLDLVLWFTPLFCNTISTKPVHVMTIL